VRVLRARRAPGRSLPSFLACAMGEQEDDQPTTSLLPHCHPDKTFQSPSPFPHSWRGGGMGGSASTARPFSPAHPSAPRRALHPSEHILIVRGLRARKLAARLTCPHRTTIFPILTSFTLPGWQGGAALYCARRTRAFPGRAFREQGGLSSLPATHIIPLINQTSHHRIGVGSIWFKRSVGTAN